MKRVFDSAGRVDGVSKVIAAFVEFAEFFAEGDTVCGFTDGKRCGCPHAYGQVAMLAAVTPSVFVFAVVKISPNVIGGQKFTGIFNLVEVRGCSTTLAVDECERILEEVFGARFIEPYGVNSDSP